MCPQRWHYSTVRQTYLMQSLFYNKVTSSHNLLNTILKGENQNWVYACGSLPLEGQKFIKLKNYKANSTPRNGCTFVSHVLASIGMPAHRGRNFSWSHSCIPTSQNSSWPQLVPSLLLLTACLRDTSQQMLSKCLLNGWAHHCTIEELVPTPLEAWELPTASWWESWEPFNTTTGI